MSLWSQIMVPKNQMWCFVGNTSGSSSSVFTITLVQVSISTSPGLGQQPLFSAWKVCFEMFKSDHTISTQRQQGPMWWKPTVFLLWLAPSLFPSHSLQPHWPVCAVSPAHETVFSFALPVPAPLPRLLFLHVFQVFAQMSPLQTVLNMPLKIVTSPHLHTLHPHPDLLFIFACFDHRSPSNI